MTLWNAFTNDETPNYHTFILTSPKPFSFTSTFTNTLTHSNTTLGVKELSMNKREDAFGWQKVGGPNSEGHLPPKWFGGHQTWQQAPPLPERGLNQTGRGPGVAQRGRAN